MFHYSWTGIFIAMAEPSPIQISLEVGSFTTPPGFSGLNSRLPNDKKKSRGKALSGKSQGKNVMVFCKQFRNCRKKKIKIMFMKLNLQHCYIYLYYSLFHIIAIINWILINILILYFIVVIIELSLQTVM